MQLEGLQFMLDELRQMSHDVCPACHKPLSLLRTFSFTCNAECHAKWIDRIVARHGEVKHITYSLTGKTYAVPTRIILEKGITGKDLPLFPEVGAVVTARHPRTTKCWRCGEDAPKGENCPKCGAYNGEGK